MIFLTVYIICFLFLHLEQAQYDDVLDQKQKIEDALVSAVEDTGTAYKRLINVSEEKKKQELERSFLESFYVSAGVFTEEEQQEKLRFHLPMLILAEEDGAYFFHMQEVELEGITEVHHVWSEKISYGYVQESSEMQKKKVVADRLEQKASEIITKHNYIAAQYGISYAFSVPDFLHNTETALEFPMIFVVFQGWPLDAAGNVVYDNCLDGSVYLQKTKTFTVTFPEDIFQTYRYFHDGSCPLAAEKQNVQRKENITEWEAVMKYGAVPCTLCIP